MFNLFMIPAEVWYFAIIPVVLIILLFLVFNIYYKNMKGTYYFNYVVDYVYSFFGIIICSILFSLMLGYSISVIQILNTNNLVSKNLILIIMLSFFSLIPFGFLIYSLYSFVKNLKKKEYLDDYIDNNELELKKK